MYIASPIWELFLHMVQNLTQAKWYMYKIYVLSNRSSLQLNIWELFNLTC